MKSLMDLPDVVASLDEIAPEWRRCYDLGDTGLYELTAGTKATLAAIRAERDALVQRHDAERAELMAKSDKLARDLDAARISDAVRAAIVACGPKPGIIRGLVASFLDDYE